MYDFPFPVTSYTKALQKREQEIAENMGNTLELEGGDVVGSALGLGGKECKKSVCLRTENSGFGNNFGAQTRHTRAAQPQGQL